MKNVISTLASGFLAAGAMAAPALTPTPVEKRADLCGQWDSATTGAYIMYQDLWGQASASSGSQCSGVDSLTGSTINWHTSWTWAGGYGQVKSFAQIYDNVATPKQLSAVSSYKTSWSYSYSGSNVVADVAYDIFTCHDTTGCSDYEVMIWLAAYGGAGPISATGSPIATVTIGGYQWKLYYGLNGSMKVYSFVAVNSPITNYSGDLKAFYTYLINNQGFPATQYIKGAAAGTEPFTGSGAKMSSTFSAVRA